MLISKRAFAVLAIQSGSLFQVGLCSGGTFHGGLCRFNLIIVDERLGYHLNGLLMGMSRKTFSDKGEIIWLVCV